MAGTLHGRRVLVTQADAFMGPALCDAFGERGAEVIASTVPLADSGAPAAVAHEAGRCVESFQGDATARQHCKGDPP